MSWLVLSRMTVLWFAIAKTCMIKLKAELLQLT
ncbi:hypothetical protein Pan181_23380 [Aeoliella mucimassa]|uniref:Uncharacterized protein n=1 Tax=Aeoliella mucimassa TaxID=2527972 RepID=A0A518AN34_9BACT|nr:hypothetical protein Pan181_23380 [Aeoliella mucimassa]